MQKGMIARTVKDAPPSALVKVSLNKDAKTTLDGQVVRIMQAWLKADLATIKSSLAKEGAWFDDTRSTLEGPVYGIDNIATSLKQTWNRYDRLNSGLMVEMNIEFLIERKYNSWNVISYRMVVTGKGSHPFKDTSHVTQVFTGAGEDMKLLSTCIVRANKTRAPVVELDYTGYPVSSLKDAETFYSDVLQLGNPYKDSAYRGYWATNSVFGIYRTRFNRDGMPRPHKSNGYVSFWVNSSQEVHDYLKKSGSLFPKISAINSKIGIDPQPGYTQILATDSEGNALLFTEYPGN